MCNPIQNLESIKSKNNWYSVTLNDPHPTPSNCEEDSYKLFDIGIEGIIINDDKSITGYFSIEYETATKINVSKIIAEIEELGFSLKELKLVEEQNWSAECSDLFEPLIVGNIKINPISEASHASKTNVDNEGKTVVNIIPGFGWGTGHHETTKGCLLFLQSDQVKELSPKNVLDMGTGSGILSIAISKLYDSTIDAVDIDNEALINTRENIKINNCTQKISLLNKPNQNNYDLIVANIYAEVLILLEPELAGRIIPGGILIVSGVIQPMLQVIEKQFSSDRWRLYDSKCENNWVTRGYQFLGL